MTANPLVLREAAQDKICRGVDALAAAVKATLGPLGCTVILARHVGVPQPKPMLELGMPAF